MTRKLKYSSPDVSACAADCLYLIATSPTGEDYTDPEEYGGF